MCFFPSRYTSTVYTAVGTFVLVPAFYPGQDAFHLPLKVLLRTLLHASLYVRLTVMVRGPVQVDPFLLPHRQGNLMARWRVGIVEEEETIPEFSPYVQTQLALVMNLDQELGEEQGRGLGTGPLHIDANLWSIVAIFT